MRISCSETATAVFWKSNRNNKRSAAFLNLERRRFFYMFCFLIPKIILKKPLKNFGLFTNTTFIKAPSAILNLSAAPAGYSEYYNPNRQYRHQKFRRAKTAYKQPQGKGKTYCALVDIEAFTHFVPSLQYQYIEKTRKCYFNLFFCGVPGL